MAQSPTRPDVNSESLLSWFASKRDGLLVLISGVYFLGYLVWSLHALRNNLGLLPAIESQYFLAGAVPASILVGIYYFLKNESVVSSALYGYLKPGGKGMRRVARWVVFAFVAATLGTYYFTVDWSAALRSWYSPIWRERPITIISLWMHYPVLYLFFHTLNVGKRLEPHIKILAFLNGFMFTAFALGVYLFWVYPYLPQELGGMKPRCAYVDVVKDQVSKDTLKKIGAQRIVRESEKTVRSEQLNIFFASKDVLLLKVADSESDEVIELRRSATPVIFWNRCGSR